MKWIVLLLAACEQKKEAEMPHAVGTYIGGVGACEYSGGPGVFSSAEKTGAKLVTGAGRVTRKCADTVQIIPVLDPTKAKILGPQSVPVNGTSDKFEVALFAGDRQLRGDAALTWNLGPDCAGHAEFAPVPTSPDTGPDRARKLVGTQAGECTLQATLTTGSAQTFNAQLKVSVQ